VLICTKTLALIEIRTIVLFIYLLLLLLLLSHKHKAAGKKIEAKQCRTVALLLLQFLFYTVSQGNETYSILNKTFNKSH